MHDWDDRPSFLGAIPKELLLEVANGGDEIGASTEETVATDTFVFTHA